MDLVLNPKTFKKFLEKNLVTGKIVVALSGGVDSFVMLDLLMKTRSKTDLIVCHVNHNARKNAHLDEMFVKSFCENNNLIFERSDFFYKTGNFQAKARDARLKFFLKICLKYQAKFIFLAHHEDDDIENFFISIIRGESFDAFLGIEEVSKFSSVKLIRPLLCVSKKEIIRYAEKEKISFREDESNKSDKYLRNRIRHFLNNCAWKENHKLNSAIKRYQETFKFLSFKKKEINYNFGLKVLKQNKTFTLKDLENVPVIFQKGLFEYILEEKISIKVFDEIKKRINTLKTYITLYEGKCVLVKEYEKIYLKPKEEFVRVNLLIEKSEEIILPYYGQISIKEDKYQEENKKLWYTTDEFPFIIRNVKDGDKIKLINGTKSVSRLLMDRKISSNRRKRALVLEKDGTILDVIGFQESVYLQNKKDNLSIKVERFI